MKYFRTILLGVVLCMTPPLSISAQYRHSTLSRLSRSSSQSAQSHILSVGAYGGGVCLLPNSDYSVQEQPGGMGGFGVGYTYYALVREVQLGIRTGLNFGYAATQCKGKFTQQFTNIDYLENHMQYTTSGCFAAQQQMLPLDIPLMMALRANGFTFNVGICLQSVLWQQTGQQLSDTHIDAFYPAYNVHVTDELITGVLSSEHRKTGSRLGLPAWSIGFATEIGYEFSLPRGYIGLQALFNCSVWNNYHPTNDLVISVSPIANPMQPVPIVNVSDAPSALITAMHPLAFGIRLYYAFEWNQ